ncbi:phosphoethanolamine transferase [Litoribaculum gwangyangense]|uniref:Phosphoethanolamine transferase CptA n=1 Tax=Litoribaculum gwangyangense TaxID=1130722 RepID=A0ABP9CVM6_9FLAO
MPKNFKHILFLSIPLILKYIFLLIFSDFDLFNFDDLKEDVLFYVCIIFLLYGSFIKRQFFVDIICLLYVLYLFLETTSYMAVSSNFSSSYMYLLIESNNQELSEFVSAYANTSIILFIILGFILFFMIRKLSMEITNKYHSIIGIFGFLGIVAVLKFTGLIENNAYHNIVRGTYGYIDLQNSYKVTSKIRKEDIKVVTDNEVLVVVLGESTTRGHMQIYGYERETTPLLHSIKDSLFIYNNVISTDVFTLKSVPKMLTSLDNDNTNDTTSSIVQIFNTAGFKTFWLANQRPISYHDNAINKIASSCNQFKFYNYIDDLETNILDEVILSDYSKILSEPGKKVVFIKLIGTHFDYKKRYPEAYNVFVSNSNTSTKIENINNYDNAVLYNDFIMFSLISELKIQNKKSALIYLSDHGENVYDNGTDFFGRSEENLTKSMFEIPFLLWTSEDFDFPLDFEYKPNRLFMTDHTYESIGHLFGVKYKNIDESKSIFSSAFKDRNRKVIDGIDFDSYFLK